MKFDKGQHIRSIGWEWMNHKLIPKLFVCLMAAYLSNWAVPPTVHTSRKRWRIICQQSDGDFREGKRSFHSKAREMLHNSWFTSKLLLYYLSCFHYDIVLKDTLPYNYNGLLAVHTAKSAINRQINLLLCWRWRTCVPRRHLRRARSDEDADAG